MCFIIQGPAKQATEKILCFKVMRITRDCINSLFHPKDGGYKLGEFIYGKGYAHGHPSRLVRRLNKQVSLNDEVVHSYSSIVVARSLRDACQFTLAGDYVVVQCIIPKGAWYWKNSEGEYASFELKLSEFDLSFTFNRKW